MTMPHDADVIPPPKGRRRRRRRNRDERQRDFYALLPHLLTTGNLAAGFYSITLSASGNPDRAALMIIVAGICDLLDGRLARMAGSTSRFGAEYDSIADIVSFGVAPAMLAYSAGVLQELGWTGWVLAFTFTACAGLRLARFNVQPERYKGRFQGLSSPAAAGMVLSSVWFGGFLRESGLALDIPAALLGLAVALLGLLMVSPIPYRSFKGVRIGGSHTTVIVMVIAFAVILSKPAVTLFIAAFLYVGSGPAEWIWRWRTGRVLQEAERVESLPEHETRGTTP
jgi:CDP-diacylglycerol--serine O-phosphatidyltransferase